MGTNNLSLQKALFYLHILTNEDLELSTMTLNSISINIYGSIMNKEIILEI